MMHQCQNITPEFQLYFLRPSLHKNIMPNIYNQPHDILQTLYNKIQRRQMRDDQYSSFTQTQSQKRVIQSQIELQKNIKLNQLSVEKIRDLVSSNMIKKSSSMTGLGPLFFNQINTKMTTHHKSITENRGNIKKPSQKSKQAQSPKKTSFKSEKAIEDDKKYSQVHIDAEEKRRRIYGMPYFFQSNTIEDTTQDIKYIAVPTYHQYFNNPSLLCTKLFSDTMSTTTSAKQSSIGLKISDFQIGKILGVGKFGHVYMAKHIQSGFMCALKQIKKSGLDQVLETQLIRQIKIQMFLNHPNIVKLYTFFADSKHIYLVLELCSSGQLYNFLRKHQPVSQDLAKVIIRQICQGLDYVHQNHIIHRDLKPENILYHNSMMKICDFGWSIATPLMRQTFCGTPLYVSPQLLKRACYNNKIDTWSLGILAYEILVGQVPFEIFCEADYIKILKNEVKFPKILQLSEDSKDFMKRCLQKDPQKRLTSSELLQHPFLKKVQLINFPQIY